MSRNGELIPSELTSVGNEMYLGNATAQAFFRMSKAAQTATGATLRVTPPDGGYRDLVAQQNLINHPEGPVPIAPLGYSTHGDGRAVDISNWASMYVWLQKHAADFQFFQQFKSEPWHWKFSGADTAGGGTLIDDKTKDDDMKVYEDAGPGPTIVNTGKFWFAAPGAFFKIDNTELGGDQFVRDIIRDAFGGVPLLRFTGELQSIGRVWLRLAPPVSAGGTTGNGSVLQAVAVVAELVTALDTKVSGFQAPPTALENGAAARAAIIK